jgi:hypothetical protein
MPGHEADEFEKHLEECPECRKIYEETRELAGTLLRSPRMGGDSKKALDHIRKHRKWWNTPIIYKPRKWVYACLIAAVFALLWVNIMPSDIFKPDNVAHNNQSAKTQAKSGSQSGIGPGIPFGSSGGGSSPHTTPTPTPEEQIAVSTPGAGGAPDEEEITSYQISLNESSYDVSLKGEGAELVSFELTEKDKSIEMEFGESRKDR